jgi:hypothetical protein
VGFVRRFVGFVRRIVRRLGFQRRPQRSGVQVGTGASLAEQNLVTITQSGNFAGPLSGHNALVLQSGHSNTISINQQ